MNTSTTESNSPDRQRWYSEVTRYQWLVLAIASAGWIFDVFEGQIYAITRDQMLSDLLHTATDSDGVKRWSDWLLSIFLIGGTVGGVGFGWLADRFGRKPTMVVTILLYSVFSGLTYFATEIWHVAVLRFLVALGVGGEWAVAAALVAEVFPARARAHASGIFHSTSILGTWMAAITGIIVEANWQVAYLVSVAPALLVLWVRSGVDEPETWKQAGREQRALGSFNELLGDWRWTRSALWGIALATVGLGMFWAVTIAGQNLTQQLVLRSNLSKELAEKAAQNDTAAMDTVKEIKKDAATKAKFAYGIVETAGGGLGLLCFGPLASRWGRRPTFAFMHLGALAIVPMTCYLPQTYEQMLTILPVYGFFTLGMHAGYAIYFPELFPNHLRATGTGLCFNGGRLLSAAFLWFSGKVKSIDGLDLRDAVTMLSLFFALGLVAIYFLPETKGRPLPE